MALELRQALRIRLNICGSQKRPAMRIVPRVSSDEIQSLVREHLATEAVIKTDGWQGYRLKR